MPMLLTLASQACTNSNVAFNNNQPSYNCRYSLSGEKLEAVRVKFSTLSLVVLLHCTTNAWRHYKVLKTLPVSDTKETAMDVLTLYKKLFGTSWPPILPAKWVCSHC